MNWKQWLTVFVITFIGTCGIIAVDQQCKEITGAGGKVGLSLDRTADGSLAFCFMGMEGEIGL